MVGIPKSSLSYKNNLCQPSEKIGPSPGALRCYMYMQKYGGNCCAFLGILRGLETIIDGGLSTCCKEPSGKAELTGVYKRKTILLDICSGQDLSLMETAIDTSYSVSQLPSIRFRKFT